jgi:hypothetical protein
MTEGDNWKLPLYWTSYDLLTKCNFFNKYGVSDERAAYFWGYYCPSIHNVSEMIRHILGVHSSQQNMEESSHQYLSAIVVNVQPPYYPDLSPLNFYLWGHLKSVMYSDPTGDEETLQKDLLVSVKLFRTTSPRLKRTDSR